jgi:enediyne biosynthesis protein E8
MGEGLSRRELLELGLAALVAQALPVALRAAPAAAQTPIDDVTLGAFADTIIPGRPATVTDLGAAIPAGAIAGVDPDPGAVEAGAIQLYHDSRVGFDALAPAFLADVNTRALSHGGPFASLSFDNRVAVVLEGLDYGNGDRVLWEAAAAVPFTAFCAAALIPEATSANASGYRVMGLPGAAPNGYRSFSYRRKLSVERTHRGSLP